MLNENNGFTHPRALYGCGNAARAAAVHNHIIIGLRSPGGTTRKQKYNEKVSRPEHSIRLVQNKGKTATDYLQGRGTRYSRVELFQRLFPDLDFANSASENTCMDSSQDKSGSKGKTTIRPAPVSFGIVNVYFTVSRKKFAGFEFL